MPKIRTKEEREAVVDEAREILRYLEDGHTIHEAATKWGYSLTTIWRRKNDAIDWRERYRREREQQL